MDEENTNPLLPAAPDESPRSPDVFLEHAWGNLPRTRWRNVGRIVQLKITDESTAITTGDSKLVFMIPSELDGAALISANAFLSTVSSSGAPSIAVRNITQSKDVLTTNLTIDASEFTSLTAATPAVIDATVVYRAGDLIAIDIDAAGTGAQGLGVTLSFQ